MVLAGNINMVLKDMSAYFTCDLISLPCMSFAQDSPGLHQELTHLWSNPRADLRVSMRVAGFLKLMAIPTPLFRSTGIGRNGIPAGQCARSLGSRAHR